MYALAVAADHLVPEANEALIRLTGKDKNEALLQKATTELSNARTIKLGAPTGNTKGATEAQFYVVLTPGPARNAQVSEVKFISGDEKLKPLAAMLKAGNFNFAFPDETTTKVIRRGTLFCDASGCSFLMLSPEYISSVD